MKKRYLPKVNQSHISSTKKRGKTRTSMRSFMSAENMNEKFVRENGIKTSSRDFFNENIREASGLHTSSKEWEEKLEATYLLIKYINTSTGQYVVESHTLRKNGSIVEKEGKGYLSYRISASTKKMKKMYEKDKKARKSLSDIYKAEIILGSTSLLDVVSKEKEIITSKEYREDPLALNRKYDFSKLYSPLRTRLWKQFVIQALSHFNSIKVELKKHKVTYEKGIRFNMPKVLDMDAPMTFILGDDVVETTMNNFLSGKDDEKIKSLLVQEVNNVIIPKKAKYVKRETLVSKGVSNGDNIKTFYLVANKAQGKVLTIIDNKVMNLQEILEVKKLTNNHNLSDFKRVEERIFNMDNEQDEKDFYNLATAYKKVIGKYVNANRYKVLRNNKNVASSITIKNFLNIHNFKSLMSVGFNQSHVCDNASDSRGETLADSKEVHATAVLECFTVQKTEDVSTRGSSLHNLEGVGCPTKKMILSATSFNNSSMFLSPVVTCGLSINNNERVSVI